MKPPASTRRPKLVDGGSAPMASVSQITKMVIAPNLSSEDYAVPKRPRPAMSAFGGKADMTFYAAHVR